MVDVDYFEHYNDHYGHPAGDQCLQQIAHAIKTVIGRAPDIVARYGGEEFIVLLPDTDASGAAILAGRIGESVRRLVVPHTRSDISPIVTVSLGVSTAMDHVLTEGVQLIALADQTLYRAKKNGRNRYEVMAAPTAPAPQSGSDQEQQR